MVCNRTTMTPQVANESAQRAAHAIGRQLRTVAWGGLSLGVKPGDCMGRLKDRFTNDEGGG